MKSYDKRTTSAVHPNVFTQSFLGRLAERDEPPTASDADVAGPWRIEPLPDEGFGLFRLGETLARGFEPEATFPTRWLALAAAAILPGTGRAPVLRLAKTPDNQGRYPFHLPGPDGNELAGRLRHFDEPTVTALNVVLHLLQTPESLANLLEAAGGVALERCGVILEARVSV